MESALGVAPRSASCSTAHGKSVDTLLWKLQTDGFHRNRAQRVLLAELGEAERQEIQETFDDLAEGEGKFVGFFVSPSGSWVL